MTIGNAAGSIMPVIMTHHMMKVSAKSDVAHGRATGCTALVIMEFICIPVIERSSTNRYTQLSAAIVMSAAVTTMRSAPGNGAGQRSAVARVVGVMTGIRIPVETSCS